MATDIDFVNYITDQIDDIGIVMSKKMFGEYMIYVNQKPVILVCNNTAYVKMLEIIKPYFENGETDFPYKGAKEHYILDIDNKETLIEIINELEKITPIQKKKKSKK